MGSNPTPSAAVPGRDGGAYPGAIADFTHKRIEEIEPFDGFIDGFDFRPVRAALGVVPFGINIIEMPADATGYPAHDHSSEGPGNPPAHQLGQEEVYIADHLIRVGPTAQRKILAGPDGVRLLAISGKPGEAYDPDAH